MNPLQKIDGHKTEAAGGLASIPAVMIVLDQIWGFPPMYDKIVDTTSLAIGILGSIGVFHKFAKWMSKRGRK